ncbi:ATM family protein [Megaselia abdita]
MTVENGITNCQINSDLVNYTTKFQRFYEKFNIDALNLFEMMVVQLSVDFHADICVHIIEILPKIARFYSFDMDVGNKESYFSASLVCLNVIYPNFQNGEITDFGENEEIVLKMLRTLWTSIEVEIKERKVFTYRTTECTDTFYKLAASLVHILHMKESNRQSEDPCESRRKIARLQNRAEDLIENIEKELSCPFFFWLNIFNELIEQHHTFLSSMITQQLLKHFIKYTEEAFRAPTLKTIRICCSKLLQIDSNTANEEWKTFTSAIISDNSSSTNYIIQEKQLIIQLLIQHQKINSSECNNLLQLFFNNRSMRRNDCIKTALAIFENCDKLNIPKSIELVSQVVNWLYKCNQQAIDLTDSEPIDINLVAKLASTISINFLDVEPEMLNNKNPSSNLTKCLSLKFNSKFLCLEKHVKDLETLQNVFMSCEEHSRNCLIQLNYEKLMRTVNFETSKDNNKQSIFQDLNNLRKLIALFNQFMKFKIFNNMNCNSCPLIKRILLFLNHIQLQLNTSQEIYIVSLLRDLKKVLKYLRMNEILIIILKSQDLDGILEFVKKSFAVCEKNTIDDVNDCIFDKATLLKICAETCVSEGMLQKAFVLIQKYKFDVENEVGTIIEIIEILTNYNPHNATMEWIIEKLQEICQFLHKDVEICKKIINLFPNIFKFVKDDEDFFYDFQSIMLTFLQKSLKKYYPPHMVKTLILTVKTVARSNPNILNGENFPIICFQVAKYMKSTIFEIHLATIECLTSLLDPRWFYGNQIAPVEYFDFSNNLIGHLNLDDLMKTARDLKNDNTASLVQLLMSLIAFSGYHKHEMFLYLVELCMKRNMGQEQFRGFSEVLQYFKCSVELFSKTYKNAAFEKMFEIGMPLERFPYFLVSSSKADFIRENRSAIAFIALKTNQQNILELAEFCETSEADFIKSSLPKVLAFISPYKAGEIIMMYPNYASEVKIFLNKTALALREITPSSGIVLDLILYLHDGEKFKQVFGFPLNSQCKTFHINFDVLKSSLNFVFKNSLGEHIKNNPKEYLEALDEIKTDTVTSIFTEVKLAYLFKYFCLCEIIMSNLENLESLKLYFIRDVIFFNINIIVEDNSCYTVKRAALNAFNFYFENMLMLGIDVFKDFLSDLSRSLISVAESVKESDIRNSCLEILKKLFCDNYKHFEKSIEKIDSFPNTSDYNDLRKIHNKHHVKQRLGGLRDDIENFLSDCNRGADGLKSFKNTISFKKMDLTELCKEEGNENLVYQLMKRLISIIKMNNGSISEQAAMCLGEIGPLSCANMTYCFDVDSDFYLNCENVNGVQSFVQRLFEWLEKCSLSYDSSVNKTVIRISHQLVNFAKSKSILSHFQYFKVFEAKSKTVFDNSNKLNEIDFVKILIELEELSYEKFICQFVGHIFDLFSWKDCGKLANIRRDFAEQCFNVMFQVLLENKEKHMKSILKLLDYFFARTTSQSSPLIYRDKKVVKYFLNVVECIRICNNWSVPSLNLLNVAKACIYCEAHFMAVLYLEIYGYDEMTTQTNKKNKRLTEPDVQEIATKAFQAIGCKDAITGFLSPVNSRLDYFVFENNWSEALIHKDSFGSMDDPFFFESLKNNGLLLTTSLLSSNKKDYEVYWQLGNWGITDDINDHPVSLEESFQKNHYLALQAIYKKEDSVALNCLSSAREAIISIIKEVSTECVDTIFKLLSKLELIEQAQDFCGIQFATLIRSEEVLSKWEIANKLPYGNFKCKHLLLEQRIRLIESAGTRANRKISEFHNDEEHIIGKYLFNCLEECKSAGQRQLISRYLNKLKILNMPSKKGRIVMEDAEICRSLGQHGMAIDILNDFVNFHTVTVDLYKVHCIRILGEYKAEVNESTFDVIHRQYLLQSMEVIDRIKAKEDQFKNTALFKGLDKFERDARMKSFDAIARFADQQYNQLVNYMKSEAFEMKKQIVKHHKEVKLPQSNDRDFNIGLKFNSENAKIDDKEINQVFEKKSEYLRYAVLNYIKFSTLNDDIASHYIYRIIGLWFANKDDFKLHETIVESIDNIPSYKFLCVINQLTAQLNSKYSSFITVIKKILTRCTEEHHNISLYHLLPIIFEDNGKKTGSKEQRVQITKDILSKVSKNKRIHQTINEMENMFSVLISFANTKTTNPTLIPEMKLLKDLSSTQFPSLVLPVSRSSNYNIISVSKWKDKVSYVGGITAPKRLFCVCSDGIIRSQLLKGNDDLRQDAVMQQVFGVVNNLLKSNRDTSQSKMLIRTYKIVPLSKRTGVLEWCNDTIPFGNYLKSAYGKYQSNVDLNKFRKEVNAIPKEDEIKRLALYKHICDKIKPIFHYFFFEKFLVPGIWFERRLAYTKSVATMSMVGFIVGLGDRHTQNILIDEITGEVIHIDFGIAFEQGKIMPTPETVPFRLTRNIVDPMGICQTEGVFKKSCEKTLHLLRENKSVLMTILEVLLYDPLYIWDYFAKKEAEKSGSSSSNENKNLTAQRALLRVQAKLDGIDECRMSTTNVEVQVNRLINDATNPTNLCKLFCGWDAYL